MARRVAGIKRSKITINTWASGTNGYWNDNLFDATEILLHEVGHALRHAGFVGGAFVDNDKKGSVGRANNREIRENCMPGYSQP